MRLDLAPGGGGGPVPPPPPSADVFLPAAFIANDPGCGPGFPARDGNNVTPLILAADMYPALERLALSAQRRLFLAFRIFDPDTRTRSIEARDLGLSDWAAIIDHLVRRGVVVRLLLTDFEPSVAHALHAGSWATFRRLKDLAATLDPDSRERLEVIISQHPGEVGWTLRQLLRLPIGIMLRRAIAALPDPDPALAVRPGWWRYAHIDGDKARFRRGPAPRLWPATHHHKFAVADDSAGIIGGIDVDERRWETRRYRQTAAQSWHDVSVAVHGPAAGDMAEHFRRLWNEALPRYRDLTRWWLSAGDRELAIDPFDAMPQPIAPAPPLPEGRERVQMLRTLSRRSEHWLAFGPRRLVRELMQAHRRLILSARRELYIEAQFVRSWRAAGWVLRAARRHPDLQIIIVLPQAPDDVAFHGQGDNPAHRHGEFLQSRALGRLLRHLGPRVGLFALGRNAPLDDAERELVADRGAAFGAGMIYVHSKVLIADGARALVSSANINGRSFNWDSEAGVLWEGPGVASLRDRLFTQLLGGASPPVGEGLAAWRARAEANIRLAPGERTGFALPYRYARVRRFGRPAWLVPDELV